MYTKALLALAPIAAQAAQSARWPVFNLRANVTEQYVGYGSPDWDRRDFWHNAALSGSGVGDITGPLVDNECSQRAGLNDHGMQPPIWKCQNAPLTLAAPYSVPYFFYPKSTSTGQYAPTEMVASNLKMKIAQKNQRDANGRRAVVMSSCGAGSTSIYISETKPYHLTYDNRDAKKQEKFGSFYLCGGGKKGDNYIYGDSLFYRSADETTPEECGEVIFYPEW